MKQILRIILPLLMMLLLIMTPVLIIAVTQQSRALSYDNEAIYIYGKAKMPDEFRKVLEPIVRKEAAAYSLSNQKFDVYTELILAIIMVESGGDYINTPDVMQSSESAGKPPKYFKTKEESIKQGVFYLHSLFKDAYSMGLDNTDIGAILQAYNMGPGFLSFYKENKRTGWESKFAAMYEQVMGGSYGNKEYVSLVQSFLELPQTSGQYMLPLPADYVLNERFGQVHNPSRFHNGIDINCSAGEEIRAIQSGLITTASWSGALGNYVEIKHNDRLQSGYGHLSGYAVSAGQYVKGGDVIGYCGTTGQSTGNHLHLVLYKDGERIDAEPYFPYRRGSLVTP